MPKTKAAPARKIGRPRREGGRRNEIVRFSELECEVIEEVLRLLVAEQLARNEKPPMSRADALMMLARQKILASKMQQ